MSLVGKGLGSEEIVITLNVMDDITEDENEVWWDDDMSYIYVCVCSCGFVLFFITLFFF